mmetsp:Transcript_86539/g.181242  ORF Transcript_86539/g.181242 Transcript_86539/m.181242 type:complete len:285 (-) Transcript_86539:494-1348(-)
MEGKGREGDALQSPALLSEQGDDFVLTDLSGETDGLGCASKGGRGGGGGGGRHRLQETDSCRNMGGHRLQCFRGALDLRSLFLQKSSHVDLGVGISDIVLQDRQCAGESLQLVTAQLRSLIPVLRTNLTALREVFQVELIVLQDGLCFYEVLPSLSDRALQDLDVALEGGDFLSVQGHLGVQVGNHGVESVGGDRPVALELGLLAGEVCEEVLQGLQNAVGVVLVGRVDWIDGCLKESRDSCLLRWWDEVESISEREALLEVASEGEEGGGLRVLERLDRSVQR